ncbi:MAG: hypothetical protein ACLGI5_14950 [Thermoleophilia bacterium]
MKARRISFTGCAAVVALALALAAPVFAVKPDRGTDAHKPYSIALSPATVPSGSQATISATYTNLTGQQQLGSSNLSPPAGFTATGAQISGFSLSPAPPAASATVDGGVVQLRDLSLPPGESVTVELQVTTPCGGAAGSWTGITKQANDFNGPPGNDLTLDLERSSTTTATTGGCRLSFTTQPADVQVGSTITGTAGDPAGPPVAVSVLDAAGNPAAAAISVTVGLGTAPVGAVLNGTKTVTSANGVASFGSLSVTEAGTYTLLATSPDATSATSDAFKAHQILVSCLNNVFCTATAATDGTVPGTNRSYTNRVRVDAEPNPDGDVADDGGPLSLSYNTGPSPHCETYEPVSPDHEVVLGPNREKTVTSTIAKAVVDARRRSAASLRTCLVAPYQFDLGTASANGGRALPIGDVDGDGNEDYSGLLPRCSNLTHDPPCQVSAGTDARGNGVVVYRLPADPRDPLGRH